MKNEKIKIHFDQAGHTKLYDDINHVSEVLNKVSEYFKQELNLTLTKEYAIDLLYNGGAGALNAYRADQSKKLDKAGLSGKIKASMLRTAEGDISRQLAHFQKDLSTEGLMRYNAVDAINYISITADGSPFVSENDKQSIQERFSVYAETEAHLEIHKAHQDAVDALNNLRDVLRKQQPRTFFLGATQFYSTFFEMNQQAEVFTPKALNYRLI
jgi:hypothetical protein